MNNSIVSDKSWVILISLFFIISFMGMDLNAKDKPLTGLQLNIKPAQSTYVIHESKEVEVCLGKNKTIHSFKTEMTLTFSFMLEGDNTISVQIDSLSLKGDSANPSSNELPQQSLSDSFQNAMDAFKGVVFQFNLDTDGNILNISGYQHFKEAWGKLYAQKMESIPFSEDYFKDAFKKVIDILPQTPVYLNSVWTKNYAQQIGDDHHVKSEHTYHTAENGKAEIRTTALITEDYEIPGHILQMKGTEEGQIELDMATGLLISSEKNAVTKGTTSIGKSNLTLTINRNCKMHRIKSDSDPLINNYSVEFKDNGSRVKQLPLPDGTTKILVRYEFYKEPDQLQVEDELGNELLIIPTISTDGEQSIIIPTKQAKVVFFKIKCQTPESAWKLRVEY